MKVTYSLTGMVYYTTYLNQYKGVGIDYILTKNNQGKIKTVSRDSYDPAWRIVGYKKLVNKRYGEDNLT